MSKFKVGDRVRINADLDGRLPRKGGCGTVVKLNETVGVWLSVTWDNGYSAEIHADWLELLSSPEEKEEGLVEGMRVRGSSAMLLAVAHRAQELGLLPKNISISVYNQASSITWRPKLLGSCPLQASTAEGTDIPFPEWWTRMEITAKELASRPKPIKVTYDNREWEAKPEKGFVRFGTCTKIPNETIRELNKVLID